jgi:methanogenic corrinoid protein MtbC1
MLRLDEERVLTIVANMLDKGTLPMDIMDGMREGIIRVRQMYEQGKFFLADLMMAAEIFTAVAQMLKKIKSISGSEGPPGEPVVIGTVKNDIHDIGKNIMVQLLQYKGFQVIDLGVDVAPLDFVRAARDHASKVLFLSGLLTLSYEPMKLTVQELQRNNLREGIKVVIGGLVNEQVRKFVNADYWTRDSWVGLDLCQTILFPRGRGIDKAERGKKEWTA